MSSLSLSLFLLLAVYGKQWSVSCEYTRPLVLPHQTAWSQRTEQSPVTWDTNNERRIINNCQKAQRIGFFYQCLSSFFTHPWFRSYNSSFKKVYVFAEKAFLWISALQMSGKNRDHFESPLSVWTNPVYKTSWESLPAKQAITVSSSSGFNVTLLHDWSI